MKSIYHTFYSCLTLMAKSFVPASVLASMPHPECCWSCWNYLVDLEKTVIPCVFMRAFTRRDWEDLPEVKGRAGSSWWTQCGYDLVWSADAGGKVVGHHWGPFNRVESFSWFCSWYLQSCVRQWWALSPRNPMLRALLEVYRWCIPIISALEVERGLSQA